MSSYFDGIRSGSSAWEEEGARGRPHAGPGSFMGRQGPSFADFLASYSPDLLPGRVPAGSTAGDSQAVRDLPHATTIVAVACHDGVVLAGDRRATAGQHDRQAGRGEGVPQRRVLRGRLAGTGAWASSSSACSRSSSSTTRRWKAARCRWRARPTGWPPMIRGNLAAAMQGLIVVPLFVGYDEDKGLGRIFSYDLAGGPYEEHEVLLDRLRLDLRPRCAEEALHRRHGGIQTPCWPRAGPVRRGRRRLGDRWPGPDPPDLPGGRHRHRGRLPAAARGRGAAYAEQVVQERMRRARRPACPAERLACLSRSRPVHPS